MNAHLRHAASALLELIYPTRANCMGCGSPLGADVDWLCAACARRLREIALTDGARRCPVCGRPLAAETCSTCIDWPMSGISAARFCYPYAPPADRMIRQLKYTGVHRMTDWMADVMAEKLAREPLLKADLMVPVPMHALRERSRGFNQSALLAQALAPRASLPLAHALMRTRNTKQQAKLNAAARRENLQGAFTVRAEVENLRILLVDDVLTTGTTANECAAALRGAGAADVVLIAFAGAVSKTDFMRMANP